MLTKRYQITLHAERLANKEGLFRVSSPFARVEIPDGPCAGLVGETEVVQRSLNPDFVKILFLEFHEGMKVPIKVTVHDRIRDDREVVMGSAQFDATTVFQSPGRMQSQVISGKRGKLYIHIEESLLGTARGYIQLHLRGLDMKNVEPGPFGLGRSDPFFELAKKDADPNIGHSKWNVVYRSEHIDNNLNPFWQETTIGLEELCYGDLDWPLRITVFDHNDNGKHDHIGMIETTVNLLQERVCFKGNADRDQAILLIQEGKSKTYGLLCVLAANVVLDSTA